MSNETPKYLAAFHFEHLKYDHNGFQPVKSPEEFQSLVEFMRGMRGFKWAMMLDRDTGAQVFYEIIRGE